MMSKSLNTNQILSNNNKSSINNNKSKIGWIGGQK